MEEYYCIVIELEKDLERIASTSVHALDCMRLSIESCRVTLAELRRMVINRGFPDAQSEICFFREIKPVADSRLLFYQDLFELESFRSKYNQKKMKQYLQKKFDKVQRFMKKHAAFVQYHNCGYTYLDRHYFVRDNQEIPVELRAWHYLTDPQFNTWQDHTFSALRAGEMLLDYLTREMKQIENPGPSNHLHASNYVWTARKIDLVELIYALFFSGAINTGKITIRELAKLFGSIFSLEIEKDVYRYFLEIQQRKIDQAKFIESLKSNLRQQIDQNI